MKQALQALIAEMEYVLSCINADKVPFDGDDFHEALRLGKEALAQPAVTESHKQRSVSEHLEPVPAAMKTVIEAMQQDPDYAWGWHCNIAMSFVDAGGDHYTGNQGAARFMRTLANVEPAHELPFSPPQRTWVGLTQTEVVDLLCEYNKLTGNVGWQQLIYMTEAKLKEKNT